jgi:dihydrofolate reductase
MIRAILACDEKWGIGKSGTLPWPHNAADLRWFKRCTAGHTVVMGRTTWDSLPTKPLPNRRNIVITSGTFDGDAMSSYLQWFLDNHMFLSDYNGSKDIWIIGGAKLFEGTLDIIDEIWLSRINSTYDCDVFLPIERIQQQFVVDSIDSEEEIMITKLVRR